MNLIKIRYLRPVNEGCQLIHAEWFMRDTMTKNVDAFALTQTEIQIN